MTKRNSRDDDKIISVEEDDAWDPEEVAVALAEKAMFQLELDNMLEELKSKLGTGKELNVIWEPGKKEIKLIAGKKWITGGEVIGTTIFIYSPNKDYARETLTHEFIEYVLKTEFSEPYVLLSQMIGQAFEDIAYFRQEAIVNALTTLLSSLPRKKKLAKLADIIKEEVAK